MAGDKKAKKQMSKEREAALAKVKNAKAGSQEHTVAVQALKLLRFKEVAAHRVGRVLAALDNLHAATDAAQYSWDATQAAKIISALEAKVNPIKDALNKPTKRKQGVTKFEL